MNPNDLDIETRYRNAFPRFARLYDRAKALLPSGVTHDGRYAQPFPIYIDRAVGSRKWDLEGNEYVDYWMGHGSLLLGHSHPVVVEAVQDQMARGTHYGACHELEITWAQQVIDMIPSAEQVRFTGSGTEATLMALRLARAFTGRDKIVKFEGHFHGWHDHVAIGVTPPHSVPMSPGILKGVVDSVLLCPPNDAETLKKILKENPDVACVIIEPTGASFGMIPTREGFLQELRGLTEKYGVLLIFDEVITGFRCAPGGAQEYYDVTPDLTTLAKILGGGLPGGCVTGRKDIMDILSFKDDPHWNRYEKMAHPGTFNANPLSASAGIAALQLIAAGNEIPRANEMGRRVRAEMNRVIDECGVNWCVYGQFSGFRVLINHECPKRGVCDYEICDYDHLKLKGSMKPEWLQTLRCGMILNGVDLFTGSAGLISSVHTEEDLERTKAAFDTTIRQMKKEGIA